MNDRNLTFMNLFFPPNRDISNILFIRDISRNLTNKDDESQNYPSDCASDKNLQIQSC